MRVLSIPALEFRNLSRCQPCENLGPALTLQRMDNQMLHARDLDIRLQERAVIIAQGTIFLRVAPILFKPPALGISVQGHCAALADRLGHGILLCMRSCGPVNGP